MDLVRGMSMTSTTSDHTHIGYANEFCPDCAAEGVYEDTSCDKCESGICRCPANPIEGTKHDQDKLRLDLIPPEALESLGAVLTFGAKKYGDNNWQNGIRISRLIGAALRHWFLGKCIGEKYDKESGLPHTWHMFTNIMFIVWTERNRPEFDDIQTKPDMSRVQFGVDGGSDSKK